MSDNTEIFKQLGISVALGLLIGLQRQHVDTPLAGLRTFAAVSLLGTLSALIDAYLSAEGWVVAASGLALAGVVCVASYIQSKREEHETGITTEIALLVMFALGAFIPAGHYVVAVAAGGAMAVLLEFKPELHGLVKRLGDDDLRAIMTFALITLVVLPILPNETYGPFDVFNPYKTWLMVVLIVGIALAGYIAYKFFGGTAGILLGGILGGAISSTATTVSMSRRAGQAESAAPGASVAIMLAAAVVYVRLLIEIGAVAPGAFAELAPPIAIVFGVAFVTALIGWLRIPKQKDGMPEQHNPAELKAALVFGVLYLLVQYALEVARYFLGGSGLYLVAALSGLTDMDAITISTARMAAQSDTEGAGIPPAMAWRLILIASISNLAFKTWIIGMLGGRALLKRAAWMFGATVAATVIVLLVWR